MKPAVDSEESYIRR